MAARTRPPAQKGGGASENTLLEPQRARILAALRASEDGLDSKELSALLGLHPNTIRWHLSHLADSQLVSSHARHRGTPGRPTVVYRAADTAARRGEGYRFLGELLASALSLAPSGEELAEQAGRAWGRHLVERPAPFARLADGELVERVVQLLDDHGFEPRREGDTIAMRHCPFRELIDSHGEIVCSAHLGLLRGALQELGSGLTVESLEAFVEPGLCVARLGAR